MKKFTIWSILALLIILTRPCAGAECPDFNQFFKDINPAKKTWNDLYRLFKSYPARCDDGVYGEGYSDFVAQSLAKYWSRFDELAALIKHDPSFKDFILKHIDATDDPKDIELLLKNARKRCPSDHVALCKEIEKAALYAITELEAYK